MSSSLYIRIPVILAAASFATCSAFASVSASTAELLLKKSGAWDQFGSSGPSMRKLVVNELEHAVPGPNPDKIQCVGRAIERAYNADHLRHMVGDLLARSVEEKDTDILTRWYDSGTGLAISKLESSASEEEGKGDEFIAAGETIWNSLSSDRKSLLEKILSLSGTLDFQVELTIEREVAQREILLSLRPNASIESGSVVRSRLQAQRQEIAGRIEHMLLPLNAWAYRPASSDDLAQYVEFLRSEPAKAYNKAVAAATIPAVVNSDRNAVRMIFKVCN